MDKTSKIYVAGHRGLVGSAIVRALQLEGYENLVLRTHSQLDLLSQRAVEEFFQSERPDYVFLSAAKVGGIHANNTYPAQFIYENLMMQSNIIHSSWKTGVTKLLFLGSSCIYPKFAPQPMREEHLLSGELEPTNEPYAVAKIAGIKTCQAYNRQYGTRFISVMPTNLYGPGDNFDLENSHVMPAMIRKFHEAKLSGGSVTLWGTGSAMREFLHVDDLASACIFLMHHYEENQFVNIGTGKDITIRELAELVRQAVGFEGEVRWDTDKPDGTPRKLLDVSRLTALGWTPGITLKDGIRQTYEWFLSTSDIRG